MYFIFFFFFSKSGFKDRCFCSSSVHIKTCFLHIPQYIFIHLWGGSSLHYTTHLLLLRPPPCQIWQSIVVHHNVQKLTQPWATRWFSNCGDKTMILRRCCRCWHLSLTKNKCNTVARHVRCNRRCCSSDATAPLIPRRHAIRMTTRWRSPWTTPPSWMSSSVRSVWLLVPSSRSSAVCFHVRNMYPLSIGLFTRCVRVRVRFQIEDIRNSIEKIDVNVAEVKKLYSVILSAPTSDQGKNCQHHELFIGFSFSFSALTFDLFTRCVLCVPANKAALRWIWISYLFAFALIFSNPRPLPSWLETQNQLEAMTNDIKKMANNARNKLKSECAYCLLVQKDNHLRPEVACLIDEMEKCRQWAAVNCLMCVSSQPSRGIWSQKSRKGFLLTCGYVNRR